MSKFRTELVYFVRITVMLLTDMSSVIQELSIISVSNSKNSSDALNFFIGIGDDSKNTNTFF